MALSQFTIPPTSFPCSSSHQVVISPSSPSTACSTTRDLSSYGSSCKFTPVSRGCWTWGGSKKEKNSWGLRMKVRSSLETVGPTATVGQVTEVNKDTFWPIVKSAGEMTVVLDMYTQWCGPCKVIAPKFQELSQKYDDVVFLKLDCNQENRPLAKELGIKVVPTFKILKDNKVIKEVTGAKLEDLVHAIETVRSG